MSLVGRLEDLGFGEILQILTISGKSGVLQMRQVSGSAARVYLTQGSIDGVLVEGGIETLAEVVIAAGALDKAKTEALHAEAIAARESFAALLSERTELDSERLDALRREVAEASVLSLFTWNEGEWTFEIGDRLAELDARELRLKVGLNAQFLALEGVRLLDEEAHDDDDFAISFSGEAETLPDYPVPDFQEECLEDELAEAVTDDAAAEANGTEGGFDGPLIAIDGDLEVLEWLKRSLRGCAHFVHIFQSLEPAVERLRYYFVRGVSPGVILSQQIPECVDPLLFQGQLPGDASAAWDAAVARLQAQGANLPLLLLRDAEADYVPDTRPFFAVATRPTRAVLTDPGQSEMRQQLGQELRCALATHGGGDAAEIPVSAASARCVDEPERETPESSEIERIHRFTAELGAPETRGQVLELVLDFASERFERVALFVLREGRLCGLAQRGLSKAGGPDAAAFRELAIDLSSRGAPASALLEQRPAVIEVPEEVSRALGRSTPSRAYWAPIRGGEELAALLYADNEPGGAPLPETRGLEVALHAAAIALERTLLEMMLERGR